MKRSSLITQRVATTCLSKLGKQLVHSVFKIETRTQNRVSSININNIDLFPPKPARSVGFNNNTCLIALNLIFLDYLTTSFSAIRVNRAD